jgi:preprotein translocase subunit Sec63
VDRREALHILALDDDATLEQVKVAYRETAQILHPDRFAGNKKLAERATEQFKRLQEAYHVLCSGSTKGSRSHQSTSVPLSNAEQLRARLAGIQAARTQLVAQRDALSDSRRNGVVLIAGGLVVAILSRRLPTIMAIAVGCIIWGAVQVMTVVGNIRSLDQHIGQLSQEKKIILAQLEELD